ncbi:MAG: SDR family oxidoreductase [Dehalococcoidia bacterium]|nr:SDR family oxidoreductase [Dehalococcoidia bacterium]
MPDAPRPHDLTGKSAVITGAASGMGRATAILLAAHGARIALADINLAGAEQVARQIVDSGGHAFAHQTDVTRKAGVDALVAAAVQRYGRLDIMGNIAGMSEGRYTIADMPEETFDRVMAINLKGAFFGCQAAMPVMMRQRSGVIINIASSAIDLNFPGSSSYSIAKAGVAMLTRVAAAEGAPYGIRVNAIAPGWVESGFTRKNAATDQEWEALKQRTQGSIPLKVLGQPEHIAQTILFLVSDSAAYLTGQDIRVNGGTSMV